MSLPLSIEGLEAYRLKLENTSSSWLKASRQKSFEQWMGLPLPTVKDEEWKYFSLRVLNEGSFCIPHRHQPIEDKQLSAYKDKADINIVLVNGVLWGELSDLKQLPQGLSVSALNTALAHGNSVIEDMLSKRTAQDATFFLSLNEALFLDGVFIDVAALAIIKPLVHIIHLTSAIEPQTIVFPRTCIRVADKAEVNILESYIGFEPVSYLSNAVTDIKIGAQAHVGYGKAQAEAHQAVHIGTTRIWQEKESCLDSFSFGHGALLTRNNLSIFIKGQGASTVMNGLYALDGHQQIDNHTLLDIQQPNCTSYQLYKGLVDDQARAVFNGKIYVHREAQKTNAYQLNKHLLLGKKARVDTKPQLEIFADDVKCTHGATIGQLSAEEIFYLQSRCIPQQTAISLLSKGFLDDGLNAIKTPAMRLKLNRILQKKFPEVKF